MTASQIRVRGGAPRTEFTDPLGAVGGGLIATPRLSVCLSVCLFGGVAAAATHPPRCGNN